MGLESTGGEALERLKELLPQLEITESACARAAESIERAREEDAAAWAQVEEASQAFCDGLRQRRDEREPTLEAEEDALAALESKLEQYATDVREASAAARGRCGETYKRAAQDGKLTLFERRELREHSARTRAQADALHERLQQVITRAAELVHVQAPGRIRALREDLEERTEAVRAHLLEDCLPRLEERAGALSERLSHLGPTVTAMLVAAGHTVGGDGLTDMLHELSSSSGAVFESMVALAGSRQHTLEALAARADLAAAETDRRQHDAAARAEAIADALHQALDSLSGVMAGFASLTLVPSPAGPIPIPFPRLP